MGIRRSANAELDRNYQRCSEQCYLSCGQYDIHGHLHQYPWDTTIAPLIMAYEQLETAVSNPTVYGTAVSLINSVGLNPNPSQWASAQSLLAESKNSLDRTATDDAASSVLLPLRGCIDSIFAELIQRVPQSQTKFRRQGAPESGMVTHSMRSE